MNYNDKNAEDSALSEFGDTQPAALPLGVGGFENQGADSLVGIDEGGRNRAGQLLLVMVIVVAAAGLFFMRSLAKVTIAATSAETEKVLEQFLEERAGSEGARGIADLHANALSVLNEAYHEIQVPLDNVQKNPFAPVDQPVNDTGPVVVEDDAEKIFNQKRAAREGEFDRALGKLKLQSVLAGSNPVANISGNIVRTGDTVTQGGVTFVVKQITTDAAQVEARDESLALIKTYTLEIERP